MFKYILCFILLSPIVNAEPIKLLMHDGATISVIAKHLNMPVIPIMVDMKDGSPLVRAGESTPNSMIFAGSNQYVDQYLFSDPDLDILKSLEPIALISRSSIALATSSKSNSTLDDIINNARIEHRSIKMGGTGFNNVCHFISGYLTQKYNIDFDYIEYSKIPQLDIDLYNQLLDVSCKFGVAIEDEAKRKYYNIIANFSKDDNTGSLKGIQTFDDLPDLSSSYILFGNIKDHEKKMILDLLVNVPNNDWLSKNHVYLNINTDYDTIISTINAKRVITYNLIKSNPTFNSKIKNQPLK